MALACLVVVGLVVAGMLGAVSTVRAQINVGEPAPNFTKMDLSGGMVSLSDYDDQVVVLFLLGFG